LTRELKPTSADYQAVFTPSVAIKAEQTYVAKIWSDPDVAITAEAGQTELKLWKATSEEIKQWGPGVSSVFPGGYERIGPSLKPGLTWYTWKYTAPGAQLGMAYNGLVYVNGHWAFFPKPWQALDA
jgi:hypothetical protein